MRIVVVSPNGGTEVEIDETDFERYQLLGYTVKAAETAEEEDDGDI